MKNQKRVLLVVISILMIILAIPMTMWCLSLINSAALEYTYAGVGCFAASILYLFSILTAIVGLVCAKKPTSLRWCRFFGYIQMLVIIISIIPLNAYAVITIPPLLILTILYLLGAKKSSLQAIQS